MPRLKSKRKGSVLIGLLEQIGPALIPAVALTAVPWCPGPQVPGGRAMTLALHAFPRMAPSPAPNAGALEEASGAHAGARGACADPDDDFIDEDEDIEEAGYTTVARALGSAGGSSGNRTSYSSRERVPTPPTNSNVATIGHVTQSGDVYHILEPEDGVPMESDIYALPFKGKGLGTTTLENQEEEGTSMDRTQQDVRRAMQVIHDTPVEETSCESEDEEILHLSQDRQATGSSSGRGTMWKEVDDSDEEAPPLPPPFVEKDRSPSLQSVHPPDPEPEGEGEGEGEASAEPPAVEPPLAFASPILVQPQSMEPFSDSEPTSDQVSEVPVKGVHVVKPAPQPQPQQTLVKEAVGGKRDSAQWSWKPVAPSPFKQDGQSAFRRNEQSPLRRDSALQRDVQTPLRRDSALQRDVQTPLRRDSALQQDAQTPLRRDSALQQDVQTPLRRDSAFNQDAQTPLRRDSAFKQDAQTPLRRDSAFKQDAQTPLRRDSAFIQDVQSPRSAGSESGGLASQLSATPRDAPSLPLEETPSPEPLEAPHHQRSSLPPEAETTKKEKTTTTRRKKKQQQGGKQSVGRQEVVVVVDCQRKMVAATAPVRNAGGSGSASSRRSASATPRGVGEVAAPAPRPPPPAPPSPSPSLKREVEKVKQENQKLHHEVTGLRKMAAAIGAAAGTEGGGSSRRSSQVAQELKGENEVLKNAVGRLNQELSHYQAAFRPLSEDDQSKLQGLPQKGPVPAWLINKRYLAPLFLAYDDLIQEKEETVRRCQSQLQSLRSRTEEVVRENQRQQTRQGAAAICASDWQALQEQARLVLEENQILTEHVDVQHRKVKDLCSSHMHEVGRLTQRLTVCEQDREEMDAELEETRCRLKDVKHKHDRLQLEAVKTTTMHDHINSVTGLQRSVIEDKEQFEREKEEMVHKLMASEEEKKRQAQAAIEAGAENQRLKAELSAMQHASRRSQNKLLVLQQAIRQSESKELVTQNELANIIKVVEKTALERDTAFRVAKEQQRDCKSTVNRIADSSVVMSRMEEKLQMYKLKASAKLQTIAEQLQEQDDVFGRQRQEYEREISYLRSLLKEKEDRIGQMKGEKREVEESLETVWQAARSENQRLTDSLASTVHKLHQHPALHAALEQEEDLERLLHFSA